MNITLADIVRDCASAGLTLESGALADRVITGISPLEECQSGDLVFMDKAAFVPFVRDRGPGAVVTSAKLKELLAGLDDIAILIAPNVGLAHAVLKQRYAARDFDASGWDHVHPSAVIHPTADIDPTAVIEPRAVIGRNARIGSRCRIMAGVVIENDVVIGDDTVIHPSVVVGYGCRIGRQVVIGSGSIIGSEGFGFAQDANRRSHAIPQTGIVVIEDRVRIGANNCIDRATYRETRIGSGTKLDNLCHVAHNVTIGEDCLLTAMLCLAGSTTIGNRVITSGQVGILDHLEVCDDVVLVHRAGVVKSITEPGVYAGVPAQPLDEYLKNTAVLRGATTLRKRIADLEKAAGKPAA